MMEPEKDPSNARVILVAEDNHDDFALLQHIFAMTGLPHSLEWASDGRQVLDYLNYCADGADEQRLRRPDLLLLDLKMPAMNGFEVLEWLQNSAEWSRLPAVVLSSSGLDEDRQKASQLGACAYYVKGFTLGENREMILTICRDWLSPRHAGQHK